MSTITPPEDRKCARCGNDSSPTSSTTLLACSRCKSTFYCNSACQSSHWPAHKNTCKRPNYLLKFHLCPNTITSPSVTRTLSVPATTTFHTLHRALQIAFGWANTHSYDFAVRDPEYEQPPEDMDWPAFFMRIANGRGKDESDAREYLLRVTETADGNMMNYKVDKMHEAIRDHPRTEEKKSERTKIFQVLDDPDYADKEMEYWYDFGDNWQHVMTVEGRSEASDHIVCIDGSGHGVPEDVTQLGWGELKEAYRTATPNQKQKERRHWFEHQASNRDPRGLGGGREHEWSKDDINRRLAAARI